MSWILELCSAKRHLPSPLFLLLSQTDEGAGHGKLAIILSELEFNLHPAWEPNFKTLD